MGQCVRRVRVLGESDGLRPITARMSESRGASSSRCHQVQIIWAAKKPCASLLCGCATSRALRPSPSCSAMSPAISAIMAATLYPYAASSGWIGPAARVA